VSNVELMHEFWDSWKEGGAEAILSRYDHFFIEDAEWCPPMREMTGARYVGRRGFEQYAHDIDLVLADLSADVEEVTELSPDVVKARIHMRGHGKVSGVELDQPMFGVARFEGGRMNLAWASYDPAATDRAAEAILHGDPIPT
jgi:ketosteroid isomerase-like protein